MKASDLRFHARLALTGKWPLAVLVGLVASVLNGASGGFSFRYEERNTPDISYLPLEEMQEILLVVIVIVLLVALVIALVMMAVGGVVQLGYIRFNLNLIDRREAEIGDLFRYFGRIKDAFVLRLLIAVRVFAWSLLLVIPGIIAAISYSMAPYIMAEDPGCTPSEAIRRSREMMDGYKVEMFVLDLSFLGWALLCALTLGLGNLLLTPYINASYAAFYRQLQAIRSVEHEYSCRNEEFRTEETAE